VPVSTQDPSGAPTSILVHRSHTKTFIVPIYSGVLGLLMPEKKYLPLNLLPLDIEITFNPYALYSSGTGSMLTTAVSM
jgi:hypothetical protein